MRRWCAVSPILRVSFVYVVFEDGTDLYWARSRVLEYLNFAAKRLPEGVTPTLGPDASGVGWVYEYVVLGAQRTLAELRSIQDWLVRYQLITAKGVAEVASVGGFERQYQVVVDPQKLQAFGIPLDRISDAIRASNQDVGGRTIEMSETEYMIRGRGYLRGLDDLGTIVLKASASGTPVLLRDVARIQLGPDERRGIAEMDGTGEVVGGIALKRDGADALTTIGNIKEKLDQLKPGLPGRRADRRRSMTARSSSGARSTRSRARSSRKALSSPRCACCFFCMRAARWSPFSRCRSAC